MNVACLKSKLYEEEVVLSGACLKLKNGMIILQVEQKEVSRSAHGGTSSFEDCAAKEER